MRNACSSSILFLICWHTISLGLLLLLLLYYSYFPSLVCSLSFIFLTIILNFILLRWSQSISGYINILMSECHNITELILIISWNKIKFMYDLLVKSQEHFFVVLVHSSKIDNIIFNTIFSSSKIILTRFNKFS